MKERQELFDEDTEMAVLGLLLEYPERLPEAQEVIAGPEDFYRSAHKLIYDIICQRSQAGKPVDALLVAQDIVTCKQQNLIGGLAYLYDLLEYPRSTNIRDYAERLRDLADRRIGREAATRFRARCSDLEIDLVVAKEQMDKDIESRLLSRELYTIPVGDAVELALERINDPSLAPRIVRTGLHQFDTIIQLTCGETGLLGGYPGVGKSALTREIIFRALGIRRQKENLPDESLSVLPEEQWPQYRVMLFSTEMDRELLAYSMFAQLGGVPVHCIRDASRRLKHHGERIVEAAAILQSVSDRFYINDVPRLTPSALVNEARLAAMKMNGIDLLVVDHINQMSGRDKSEDMRLFMDRVVRDNILPLAKELQAATIIVSQLNRSGYNLRSPTKALFKESGGLEESAFWAGILWENTTLPPFLGKGDRMTDLVIVKNKSGPEIKIPVVFRGHCMRHRELTTEELTTYHAYAESTAQAQADIDDPDEVPF